MSAELSRGDREALERLANDVFIDAPKAVMTLRTALERAREAANEKHDADISHICMMIECAGNPTVVTASDPSEPELGNVEVPLAELVRMTFKGSIRSLSIEEMLNARKGE